jgi:hypothetical protein
MKKFFAKEKTPIYFYLSVFSLAGFGIALTGLYVLSSFYMPVDAMPISNMPRLFFYVSMVFGGLAVISYWKVNIPVLVTLTVAGFLLIAVFNFFAGAFLYALDYGREETVVVESKLERNNSLGYGVAIIESVCISNGHFIDIYNVTKIYEQDGATHKKKRVEPDALKPGQVIDIIYSSFGDDDEFFDLLEDKSPGLDITLWHGAAEITIHKGEYRSVDLKTGVNFCESLFGE